MLPNVVVMTNTDITPFTADIPESELDDLRARVANTRWAATLPGTGRGIAPAELEALADHWVTGFDWREAEAQLNRFPQFRTEIDGQTIHFIHVRAADPNAVALVLTHGYPSSIFEFLDLIEPLARHFHVVVPSLPGFGFSTPVHTEGWAMTRTARAWAELMRRLGYHRYGVHGGDIGGGVAGAVAGLDPDHVVGVHVVSDPLTAANVATFLPGLADDLDPADDTDKLILDRMQQFRTEDSGYLAIQNTRPQLMGYGLSDSPVFQLGWMAEKFDEWTDLPIDRDRMLATIGLYWFTGSGTTAANFLYEQAHAHDWGAPGQTRQGFAIFGADPTVRRVLAPAPGTHWTEFPHGLHFPALEAPADLVADLVAFFG